MNEPSQPVRFGVIGLGMGAGHAASIRDGQVPGASLTAVCDIDSSRLASFRDMEGVAVYDRSEEILRHPELDAVIVATPHYSHPELSRAALEAGKHVMVEKPIAVDKQDAGMLLAIPRAPGQQFGAMFNQRTDPCFRRLKSMIDAGELGRIIRINWIITDWFRTEQYYRSGGWRATWAGEGGGVLINQCPHQLDLLQWLFGMPANVRAKCRFGHHHNIEVEDEVTAYLEYADGASGIFIASTGEAPGTNRLEVTADNGNVVIADRKLVLTRNATPVSEFNRTSPERFAKPSTETVIELYPDNGEQHAGILRNFVAAIRGKAPLIAPAEEGIRSVELGNSMLYSSQINATVELPLDSRAYRKMLEKLTTASTYRKPAPTVSTGLTDDLKHSF